MSELNVDREMVRQALTDEERELLEIAVVCYDVLVEEKESPGHYRYDWAKRHSNYLPAMRELAARFHRGTVNAVAPRAFTQCVECGEEIEGRYVNEGTRSVDKGDPFSRHLDGSLCAFFVLARVHRARGVLR